MGETMNLLERLQPLADEVAGTPRLSRAALMRILRACYAEGLAPISDSERDQLLARIHAVRHGEGANRVFAKRSRETPHTLIVRVVFASASERGNASRYATSLAFLAKSEIPADQFDAALSRMGGLTGTYWEARGRTGKTMRRNKLSLSTTIQFTAGREVFMRLMPRANGVFDLLELQGGSHG